VRMSNGLNQFRVHFSGGLYKRGINKSSGHTRRQNSCSIKRLYLYRDVYQWILAVSQSSKWISVCLTTLHYNIIVFESFDYFNHSWTSFHSLRRYAVRMVSSNYLWMRMIYVSFHKQMQNNGRPIKNKSLWSTFGNTETLYQARQGTWWI